ncbi:hypothetical protein [Escherichia coli]|uniref:hypothetical protein n=1 Tax=Escherichia coli TaxID=562 RepID=UPI0013E8B074|nr:hypothetical protein [Escherichia coli]
MNLDLSHLAEMTAADEARFFTIFDRQLEYDSGEEARSNLLSGVILPSNSGHAAK